jgi:hypothetical protein
MSSINSQITDSVRQVNDMTISEGADASMAATFMAAANSIGIVMANAAIAQQGMQQIAQSATAVTCGLIIAKAFSS